MKRETYKKIDIIAFVMLGCAFVLFSLCVVQKKVDPTYIYEMTNSKYELSELVNEEGILFFANTIVMTLGIFLFLMAFLFLSMKLQSTRKMFSLSFFIIACSTWFFSANPLYRFLISDVEFVYLLDFFSQYMITVSAICYAIEFVSGIRKKALIIFDLIALAFVVAACLLQWMNGNGFARLMYIGIGLNIIFIFLVAGMLCHEAFACKNKVTQNMLLSATPVLLGGFAEILNYIFGGHWKISLIFLTGLFVFIVIQATLFVVGLKKNADIAERNAKLEAELAEGRMASMLSQIQPHFIFNSLTAIGEINKQNPTQGVQALYEFSDYLRANFDSLTNTSTISFEKELAHTKNYLSLEKKRFEDRVQVSYDIEATKFSVPPLTLQPLVENAVRHGVTAQNENGQIHIATRELGECWQITIKDDGVGFVTDKVFCDNENIHVGIDAVKQRLAFMCDGTLSIESVLGKGTTCIIEIPKQEDECEYHCG